ncbi:SDR family oxidoreductase [Paenibacillus macquariensis]|uniref:NAD(P)-dependent dehydrogenase, short-chain alcohol dehydrogenase family n=1 Tax=Paenibacillus macquariensis TaxID=948756 RepID=A0ABY1K615_9BACL|nr:SDR family oxidoreductase [Paenibacillus macquariensis]MEC0090539.1 SDR family oxidoreductase [Paenibacillus macquariensis]OAB38538.1 2,4-dienoyl-CoA reductase [Paenibacillus macquariensis subsp. macquariensis]SIR30807.1 NAD(P)-dependent dehydrogenase, short-chain alcohol dehydrogenase family [Paenibacillus macquariensis]
MGPFAKDLLKDKVVLITGGATGLGRAMGEQFLELGAKLAIASRREETLRTAAEELSIHGGEVFYQATDVRDPVQIHALVEAVEQRFGRIDVLVNNAAGNFISPTERLSPRAVDTVLNIVLHGTMYTTLEVGKRWINQGHQGTMLNIVTTYASTGSAFVVPSAAAKAGVLALTRSLAVEWARYGIRQVAIAPGPFPTEGATSRLMPTPEIEEQMLRRIPSRRVGNKEELAHLAAYLISDYAGYINGEVVTIDGGEWLQGAGEFNDLLNITEEQWDALAEKTRKGK